MGALENQLYENETFDSLVNLYKESLRKVADAKQLSAELEAIIEAVRRHHPEANRLIDDIIEWRSAAMEATKP